MVPLRGSATTRLPAGGGESPCLHVTAGRLTSCSCVGGGRVAISLLRPSRVGRWDQRRRSWSCVVCMAPEEEKITRRSPLDFPIGRGDLLYSALIAVSFYALLEWERPKPGRRPDIFPKFSPMKTPLTPPLPADPPEEDEDEEEKKGRGRGSGKEGRRRR